jgi:hypothetical protein
MHTKLFVSRFLLTSRSVCSDSSQAKCCGSYPCSRYAVGGGGLDGATSPRGPQPIDLTTRISSAQTGASATASTAARSHPGGAAARTGARGPTRLRRRHRTMGKRRRLWSWSLSARITRSGPSSCCRPSNGWVARWVDGWTDGRDDSMKVALSVGWCAWLPLVPKTDARVGLNNSFWKPPTTVAQSRPGGPRAGRARPVSRLPLFTARCVSIPHRRPEGPACTARHHSHTPRLTIAQRTLSVLRRGHHTHRRSWHYASLLAGGQDVTWGAGPAIADTLRLTEAELLGSRWGGGGGGGGSWKRVV